MPTVLWFRRDVRLHDLPPLLEAAKVDGDVLACYVLDPRLEVSSGQGATGLPVRRAARPPTTASAAELLVTHGRPEKRIPAVAKAIGASEVHVSGDYTPFGQRRDDAVPRRSARYRWRRPGRRTWSRRAGSPRTTERRTKSLRRTTTRGGEHGRHAPAKSGPKTANWIDPGVVPGCVGAFPTRGPNSGCRPARRRPTISRRVCRERPRQLRRRPRSARSGTPPAGCRRI